MRIAVFQGPVEGGSVARNLERLAAVAAEAAGQGAGLLVCPEMFLTGYNIGAAAVRRLAEPVAGPSAEAAAGIARRHRLALLYGYPEAGADGRVYNAALLLGADGAVLANHRKTHLFGPDERDAFVPGDGPPAVAEVGGVRVGVLICYDVEFPENVRLLALQGVGLVAVPTALMEPYEFVARTMVPTRAYENQVFLAYANRCGREGDLAYHGLSCIVGPDGRDLARAPAEGEALIVAELDRGLLEDSRRLNPYLADRRPALYGALAGGGTP